LTHLYKKTNNSFVSKKVNLQSVQCLRKTTESEVKPPNLMSILLPAHQHWCYHFQCTNSVFRILHKFR